MNSKRQTVKAAKADIKRSGVRQGAQEQEQLGLRHTRQHMSQEEKGEMKEIRRSKPTA